MPDEFKAEVFQNQFLPLGANEVHAIMTVTAGQSMGAQSSGRLFGIICDTSGSMEGVKILAARAAMTKLVTMLPESCSFFIVTGSDTAKVVRHVAEATPTNKDNAIAWIRQIKADGGTTISVWLQAALKQFQTKPNALKQALLLTDGQNDDMDDQLLEKALEIAGTLPEDEQDAIAAQILDSLADEEAWKMRFAAKSDVIRLAREAIEEDGRGGTLPLSDLL